jgi:hypothetical protein
MRGFFFTVDALFAAVVSITLVLSLYLVMEKMEPLPSKGYPERDILASVDKLGTLGTLTSAELGALLGPYNRCGKLTIKSGGAVEREVESCGCGEGEFGVGTRTFVRSGGGSPAYSVAILKTCMRS